MDLRDELEQKQKEAEALGKLSLEERKELAAKSDVARKNTIIALSKKYGNILEEIREIEMDIADEEGREPPAEMTRDELESRKSEFFSKVMASIKERVALGKETRAEAIMRDLKNASKVSLYDSMEQYIREAVPFNPETNNNISMKEMFSRVFDEIAVKNLIEYRDKDLLQQLEKNMEGKSLPAEFSNFISNAKLLMEAAEQRREGQEEFSLEGTYTINVGKFFGAIDLSDADSRESVYEYWKDIDAKYEDFTDALKAFLDAAENSENEEFASRVRKFRDKHQKGDTFLLRYVYDVPPIPTPRMGAKKKLIQVIENLLIVEGLADRVEQIAGEQLDEEDRLTDELVEQLADFKETFSDAMEIDLEEEAIEGGDVLVEGEAPEEKDFNFEEYLTDDVDILLATEMMRSKRLISATEDMAVLLRQYLDTVVAMLPERKFKSIETYIDRFKDEIKNSLILEREDYFIPVSVLIQPQVKNQLKGAMTAGSSPDEAEQDIEAIAEFFDDLEAMLRDWENQTMLEVAPRGGQAATSIESREDPTGRISGLLSASSPTIAGKRTKLPKYLEEQKETLVDLVDAIIEYYVNPIYSGRMPVSIPAFANKLGFKDVLVLAGQLGAETATGKEYMRATAESISSLEVDDIRNLRQFFSQIFSKNVKPTPQLIKAGQQAADSLDELFGNEEANANYISAVVFDVMRNTGKMDLAERTIKTGSGRKSIMERAELYQDSYSSNKAFPIFGLPLYLDMNEGLFYNHPNSQMKSEYDGLVNVLKETGDDLPVMLKALLEAHDEIRKALGKEVQHGFMPLSYDAISKFLAEENIDLTTFEVENIVKSYDSHKNIGTEYGIGSENVYLIKANFR